MLRETSGGGVNFRRALALLMIIVVVLGIFSVRLFQIQIVQGEDLCTLLTCTPYGVNSHRLLVRGSRIENIEPEKVVNVITEAYQIDPLIVTPAVAAPMLGILLLSPIIAILAKVVSKRLND